MVATQWGCLRSTATAGTPPLKDLKKGTPKDLTGGTSVENDVTLGTGELDIAGIVREANKLGIKHFFIEDESSRVTKQVPQSIAYLKSLKK